MKRTKKIARWHNHVSMGKIIGTYGHGVSIDDSPLNIDLHVGDLKGRQADRKTFRLNPKTAMLLGVQLIRASIQLELALERNKDAMAEMRRRQRQWQKSQAKKAALAGQNSE
jgi:hypothetical protein